MISRSMRLMRWAGAIALMTILAAATAAFCEGSRPAEPIVVRGLGTGSVPLGGDWAFHTGDKPIWAEPDHDDSGWKTIDIARPWGDQGYWSYSGYAWYRRQIDFGSEQRVDLFIPEADCVYELYWNGARIGGSGPMPGAPGLQVVSAAVYELDRPGNGTMAIRVWTRPNDTSTPGDGQGFFVVPRAANPETAANLLKLDHEFELRASLADLVLMPLYAQLALLGFLIWIRHREQRLIFWLMLYCLSLLVFIGLTSTVRALLLSLSSISFSSPFHALNDIALWYLLIYLLGLDRQRAVLRSARILAIVSLVSAFGDSWAFSIVWSSRHVVAFQVLDAVFTAGFAIPELLPLVLVGLAIGRGRLGFSRWIVAIAAAVNEMLYVTWHSSVQGMRFTRITLGDRILAPVFTVRGVPVNLLGISSLALLIAILYAAFRYVSEESSRQRVIREELKSAQELQRVLIPEALPRLPGFAITSAYQPAAEVGGDFFQLIAVDKETSVLVVGDVSGKGLKAAMTVSLIIGALRTLTDLTSQPDKILEMLNRRMVGRLQNGFVTCLVVRIGADGSCMASSAGHPAPFVGTVEVAIPPALPLGLDANARYEKQPFDLRVGARMLVYTDGLLEARNREGELFSFTRLEKLVELHPDAKEAVDAAIEFGQEDDITVLTLTRLDAGQRSTTSLLAPELEPVGR